MPKAFTEQERALIVERLMEQGRRQFAAHGLKKVSVEELATAAGVSKGAFYLFFPSKEALFMDVVEEAERQFRREMLAVLDEPGPTPRARLLAVFKRAFGLWRKLPLLQVFTRSDYELLLRRMPAEKVQEHMAADRAFIEELVTRARATGIPIQAPIEEISGLLYALFLFSLHQDDLGPGGLAGAGDLLLELIAAYCLGEVQGLQGASVGS